MTHPGRMDVDTEPREPGLDVAAVSSRDKGRGAEPMDELLIGRSL